jgi:hypothetical protein
MFVYRYFKFKDLYFDINSTLGFILLSARYYYVF